ncbi:hypothetical protein [Methylobacterium sp.]|uniref:hypothetical protein n=1 Tax=Methylobacterium sp. TaxID=409 RepID=UPI003B5AA3AF
MLVQGVTSAADRVAKEVDLDQVVAAAVVATQEAIYFFGYKDLQVSGASPAQILRQTDADGKTILGPIDPLDPIRASIEDLRDNVDDRIYYFGSKDLVTTDLDPVTNTAIQLSRIDGDGVAEVGVVLERDWRPTIIAGDAYAFDKNGARVRLTASRDVVRCDVRNATAEFDRITAAGVFSRTRTKLYGSSSHLLSTTKIIHIAGLGQSLSVGNSGVPLFTTTPVRPGRVLSFNAGVLTYGSDHNSLYLKDGIPNVPVPPANIESLIDCRERYSETFMSSEGEYLTRTGSLPSTTAVLMSAHGVGGLTVDKFFEGGVLFENAVAAVAQSWKLAQLFGLEHEVILDFEQGESNASLSSSVAYYKDAIVAKIQQRFEARVQDIKGTTETVPMFISQMNSWTGSSFATSNVPVAQFEAAMENPGKVILANPKYIGPFADKQHYTTEGYMDLGSMRGYAIDLHRKGGVSLPPSFISAVRSGTELALTFRDLPGTFGIDRTRVTDPGNDGVVWSDDGTGSSVSIVPGSAQFTPGSRVVKYQLSAVPTGGAQTVRIGLDGIPGNNGGPTTGPRTTFRIDTGKLNRRGNPLYRDCVAHKLNVTTA